MKRVAFTVKITKPPPSLPLQQQQQQPELEQKSQYEQQIV